MCHSMLRPIREDAGLGCPPEAFYTNASESVNNVIKRKVDYKRSDLPQFIQKLKELAIEQEREVERAIIGRGKYCFQRQYQHVQVDESRWFTMSKLQREKHIHKVMSMAVSDTNDSGLECSASGSDTSYALSADLSCLSS